MSKYYTLNIGLPTGQPWQNEPVFGKARGNQQINELNSNFDTNVLFYLNETIINHLLDSLKLDVLWREQFKDQFNDFSFFTAPAYKAFEGFLFQIASDLRLPSSGNADFVGTYFDEKKIDQTINRLLKELEMKTDKEKQLTKEQKIHIKDNIKEMKRFLQYYRHTPAHFQGESIDTLDKARQNIMSIYRIINETVKTLLKAELVQVNENLH